MSRERFISPSTWASEQFCSVSFMADLLFIGIISTADDHGRRRGSAHSLLADIFPNRGLTSDQVLQIRASLQRAGLIQVYLDEVGHEVICIPERSWKRYQKPRYVSASKHPPYPGAGDVCTESVQVGTEGVQDGTESAQICCSGVVWRGVVGSGVTSPPLPSPSPLTLDVSVADSGLTASQATSTAGSAHRAPERPTATANVKDPRDCKVGPVYDPVMEPSKPLSFVEPIDTTPTCEPAASVLSAWLSEAGEAFARGTALEHLCRVTDHSNPVFLLAQLRDIEAANADPASRCKMLWTRLATGKPRPSETAWERARADLNGGPGGGGSPASVSDILPDVTSTEPRGTLDTGYGADDDTRGGVPSSPSAGLQERLEARRAERDDPPAAAAPDPPADDEPVEPIVRRSQRRRRQRTYDAEHAEVPAPILAACEGLTEGWSFPGETNHDVERRALRALLAGDAIRALAYVDQINRTAIVRGDEPWGEVARMCRELTDPDEKGRERAIEILRGISTTGAKPAEQDTS